MKAKKKGGKEKLNSWEAFAFTLIFGLLILFAGGWNIYTIVIGGAISLIAPFEIPAIRLYFELKINKASGTNVFQIEDSKISGSNVVFNPGGDVIIQQKERHEKPATKESTRWLIHRKFTLASDDHYKTDSLRLKEGQSLKGEVKSNGAVDVYIMGKASLKSFEDDYDFNPYWHADSITETAIEFETKQDRDVYVIIHNDYGDENDDSVLHIELNLRIAKN
jgi:hypothetical protein